MDGREITEYYARALIVGAVILIFATIAVWELSKWLIQHISISWN